MQQKPSDDRAVADRYIDDVERSLVVDFGKAEGVADRLVDANDDWLMEMLDAGTAATSAARELVVELDRASGSLDGDAA